MRKLGLLFLILLAFNRLYATHVAGGEITWSCNGNSTVFRLTFYRDCNGADVNPLTEDLKVWYHPTLSQITLNFVSRTEISPSCTPVAGSPPQLDCGAGPFGGNGIGATEKVIYESAPILLAGLPPLATGWVFTYENFSRSAAINNLTNPSNFGVTITAKMYRDPTQVAGQCSDNSPYFLQDPYLIVCAGETYSYNMNHIDDDGDSLTIDFGQPLNNFPAQVYNPPSVPAILSYDPGFSFINPTPDATFNVANQATQLNNSTGHLTFRSNTSGGFVIKLVVKSYRNGVLIAEIMREMQVTVVNCGAGNNAPIVNGPFGGGLFNTTVNAGTLVNFTIQSNDPELLQDGTPQSNFLTVSGPLFGTNFTSNTGCDITPCATLNQTPLITGIQGVSSNFSWQTDCDHLVDALGNPVTQKDFTYVFRFQDNYCQIPKVTYRSVTIRVVNPGLIPAPQINCISTAVNGDVTIDWADVNNASGAFVEYEVNSVENGLISITNLATSSFTVPNPGNDFRFFVGVESGCGVVENSDTLKNVFLTVFNPNTGIALLSWNTPATNPLPGMTNCIIEREYPAGTWTTIATLPYGVTNMQDTIRICSAFLNYRVSYPTPSCAWNSNIAGGLFDDMLTPSIPILSSASIDTLTGNVIINWNQNDQPDTYGYIVYWKDANGFIVEIDTVFGIANTSYNYNFGTISGPLTYSIAAFDSCFTALVPPTFQTSAKGNLNTTMFTTAVGNACNSNLNISWTSYVGWGASLQGYAVFVRNISGGAWLNVGTTSSTSFSTPLVSGQTYEVVVQANNSNGAYSFSNKFRITLVAPSGPTVNYLQVATVNQDEVILRYQITAGLNVKSLRLEKYNDLTDQFEELTLLTAAAGVISYTDTEVEVQNRSYTYRVVVIDSCDGISGISNSARTILLKVKTDQTALTNTLNWSAYTDFMGGVLQYEVFRSIDGNFWPVPIASTNLTNRFFVDDISLLGVNSGNICYLVTGNEGTNALGLNERSFSNIACGVIEPIVYIPNAFTPGTDNVNDFFKPVVTYYDIASYEFSIVDRWGQVVFQTTDSNLGWNGEHETSGKLVTNDLFCYVLKLKDGNNQEYFYRGTVSVLR